MSAPIRPTVTSSPLGPRSSRPLGRTPLVKRTRIPAPSPVPHPATQPGADASVRAWLGRWLAGRLPEASARAWFVGQVGERLEAGHRVKRGRLMRLGLQQQTLDVSGGSVTAWHRPRTHQGRPWVFVHGFLGQSTNWLALLETLEVSCPEVWALDMPGHGLSPAPRMAVASPEDGVATALMQATLSDARAKITRDAGGQAPVVVATSAGALLAARAIAAARSSHPQDFRAPALADAKLAMVCPLGAPMGQIWRARMLDRFAGRAPRHSARTQPLWVDVVHSCAVASLLQRPFQARLLAEFAHLDMLTPQEMACLPADTFVACGGRDTLLSPHTHRLFRRHLPDAATCVFEPEFDHLAVLFSARPLAAHLLSWADTGADASD